MMPFIIFFQVNLVNWNSGLLFLNLILWLFGKNIVINQVVDIKWNKAIIIIILNKEIIEKEYAKFLLLVVDIGQWFSTWSDFAL
jgi:hypothetical protein